MKLIILFICFGCAFCELDLNDVVRMNKKMDFISKSKPDEQTGEHWALVVAGSNGWYNYRHQADACHAYQVLRRHGFPEDRIITMMFDDIANNEQNPTMGQVINHPNGTDVYKGVKIDYREKDVTPENFLSVMSGDAAAMQGVGTGRVIASGPNDHVFVNFVDHGAPGILAFPRSELHVKDLMRSIKKMYKQKKYKQMVFYVEACESGSMFHHHLPQNISVYATTAANTSESSYACYFDNSRNTYLGDVYSVKWMEDSDKENLSLETLHKQFEIVKSETNTSHVKQYGDRNISNESVSEFQGDTEYQAPQPIVLPEAPLNAVASEDVPLTIVEHKLMNAKTPAEQKKALEEYKQIIMEKTSIEVTMMHIVSLATGSDGVHSIEMLYGQRHELIDLDCYEPAAKTFDERCFDLSRHEYAMRNMYAFVNLCESGIDGQTIINAIKAICI